MSRHYDGPPRYPLHSAIGNGAYGNVYKAHDRDTGAVVALKQVRIRRSDNGCPASLLREVAALKRLSVIANDNLVRLLDVCYVRETNNLYLVFEHLDVDLSACLQHPDKVTFARPFNPSEGFRQLLLGLAHLHRHALLHRDIKPANILLSKPYGHVKLADFGLTRVYTLACCLTSVVVTLWYRAPEIVLRTDYGTPIDIWSCGCVLAEMYLQRMPLFASESDSDVAQLKAIFSTVGLPLRDEWPADAVVPYESFSSWFQASRKQLNRSNVPETVDEDNEDDVNNASVASSHNSFEVNNLSLRLSTILPPSTPTLAVDLMAKLLSFDPSRRLNVFEALEHPFIANVDTYHGPECKHCTVVSKSQESHDENAPEEQKENDHSLLANKSADNGSLPVSNRLPTILRQNKRKVSSVREGHLDDSSDIKRTPVSATSAHANEESVQKSASKTDVL